MRAFFLFCAAVSFAPATEPAFISTRSVNGSGSENIVATALDPAGNLIIAGTTTSTDLPGRVITRLTPEASLLRSGDTGLTWTRAASQDHGYFRCLEANPRRSKIVLACGTYGIARSADSGTTWTTLPNTPAAYRITHHPTNPDVFYAIGTNGPFYRSVDAGITWQEISNPPGSFFELSVDPFDPGVILLGSWPQILRSTDGGLSWKGILASIPSDSIVFDPHKAGRVYALGQWYGSPRLLLRVSTDHGANWTLLPPVPSGILRVDPRRVDTLWIVSQSAVFRSQDAGRTFTQVGSFSGWVLQLVVLPTNPTILVASTSIGVQRSADEGQTWNLQKTGWSDALLPIGDSELLASIIPAGDIYVSKVSPDTRETLFTTYIGGAQFDQAYGMKVDPQGNVLVVARTESDDFPGSGKGNIVVFKLASTGERLLYSARLGGTESFDEPNALSTDAQGNVYLAGSTRSADWPVTTGVLVPTPNPNSTTRDANCNGFVVKVDSEGQVVYSTILGGSDSDRINALAVDPTGAVWLTGSTQSANFPVTANALRSYSGGVDAFITQLSPSGAEIRYSTFYGGSDADSGNSITVDSEGNVYVAGESASKDFPTSPGAFQPVLQRAYCHPNTFRPEPDGFILRLNPDSSVAFATFTGTICYLTFNQIEIVDRTIFLAGNLSPGGLANSYPFRQDIDGTPNAFLARMNVDGTSLEIGPLVPGGSPSFALTHDKSRLFVGTGEPSLGRFPGGQAFLGLLNLDPSPKTLRVSSVTATLAPNDISVGPGDLATIFVEGLNDIESRDLGFNPPFDLPYSLNGVQVWFDGQPAPILSVEPGRIVCVIPSSLRPEPFAYPLLDVAYKSVHSSLRLSFVTSVDSSHVLHATPDGALVSRNEDGSLNSEANPAQLGSILTLYASGLGPLTPSLPDGMVAPATPSRPINIVQATVFNGPLLEVLDVSTMPGFISSLLQINLRLPRNLELDDSRLRMDISSPTGRVGGYVFVRR